MVDVPEAVPGFAPAEEPAPEIQTIPGFSPMLEDPALEGAGPGVKAAVEGEPGVPGFSPLDDDEPVEGEGGGLMGMAGELKDMFVGRLLGTDIDRDDPLMWIRMGTQIKGAIGGGALAAEFGGRFLPGATPPTAVAKGALMLLGAGIGSVAGAIEPEMGLEIAESIGLVEEGTRERLGLSDSELRTVVRGEALLEVAFPGAFGALKYTKRGAVQLALGLGREQRALATRLARDEGIWLTPIQLGRYSIPKGYVFIFGRIPTFGGGKVKKAVQATEEQYKAALEGLGSRVGQVATWSTISDLIYRDAKNVVQFFRDDMSRAYEALWARADELGVTVIPVRVFAEAERIVGELTKKRQRIITESIERTAPQRTVRPGVRPGTQIVSHTPGSEKFVQEVGLGDFPDGAEAVIEFINKEILPMRGDLTGKVAGQTFRAMDGLAEKVSTMLAKLDPVDQRAARMWMTDIMQAIQADALEGAVGVEARQVRRELVALDEKYSKFWTEIADTATAKKFGAVQKKGLRGVTFDDATRLPVDQLTNIIRLTDSEDVAQELHRLVGQDTYNRIVATYLEDAFERAFPTIGEEAGKFHPRAFRDALGLSKGTSNRRAAVAEMLRLSGSGLTVDALDEMMKVADVIQDVDIANVSVFLARSATIGGARALVNRLIPGVAAASAAGAGVTQGFLGVGFLTAAAAIFTNRSIMKTLADPKNAQLVKAVFDKDAKAIVKSGNIVKLLRLMGNELTPEDLRDKTGAARTRIDPTGTRFVDVEKYRERANEFVDMFVKDLAEEADFYGLPGAAELKGEEETEE